MLAAVPAGSVVLACAVVPAVVLAGGGVLAGWCRPCLVGVCCWVWCWLLGVLAGWKVGKREERKTIQNKHTNPKYYIYHL